MLQSVSSVFVVYRRKTLTGSPDTMHVNGTDKPCIIGGEPGQIMPSSVPRYLGFSDSSRVCFTAVLHRNMRKNGTIPDDSVGKKLHAAVAFDTRSSHLMRVSSCFAIVALRNLWNPSILPLYCGK